LNFNSVLDLAVVGEVAAVDGAVMLSKETRSLRASGRVVETSSSLAALRSVTGAMAGVGGGQAGITGLRGKQNCGVLL
jgi:hypothetical protein